MSLEEILSPSPTATRLPPHSQSAEEGVIACCMLEPRECIGKLIERFKQPAEAFYDLRRQSITQVLVEMYDSGEAIDFITLVEKITSKGQFESVGGVSYLMSVQNATPSAANMDYYLDILEEKYLYRKTITVCTEAASTAYECPADHVKFMDGLEADVLGIRGRSGAKIQPMGELVKSSINRLGELYNRKGSITGLPTGFLDLDRLTNGMNPADMIVIAARPSVGKSTLIMNIADHVATNLSVPVGVFSLEMTAESLVTRTLCSRSRVNIKSIQNGHASEDDFKRMTVEAKRLTHAPLYIDDEPGLSIMQLRAKARRMHQQFGVKLFVIDYLQMLHSTSKKSENRQQEVADISNGIKSLAKELKIPVIVAAQLNREVEKDKARKPRMSDLRESGSIEQDADIIGLLYRHMEVGKEEDPEAEEVPVNLLIAKQRNGPPGVDVHLMFHKSITRFESVSKFSNL